MAGLCAPCRRFAVILADADARLGANADCYSFIAVDFHHLLFAGFYRRTSLQDFRNSTYELDIIVIMVEIDPAACRRWLIRKIIAECCPSLSRALVNS